MITEHYQSLLHDINQGYNRFGCINENELILRFKAMDALIESIKQNGYKDHKTRIKEKINQGANSGELFSDEVTVNISRDGKYLFQNGRHRLSVALALDVEKIPVKVLVRHEDWVLLRKKILKIVSNSGGTLYQSALHIDLLSSSFNHNNFFDRRAVFYGLVCICFHGDVIFCTPEAGVLCNKKFAGGVIYSVFK